MIHPPIFSNDAYEIRLTAHGTMMYPKNDYYVGRALRETGEYSIEEWELMREMLLIRRIQLEKRNLPMDNRPLQFFDCGANVGCFSMSAAKYDEELGPVEVTAFEPSSLAYYALASNVALNAALNVKAVNAAVGNEDGHFDAPVPEYKTLGNYAALTLLHEQVPLKKERVRVVRLDDFLWPNRIIDVMKIDVEGMEEAVIRGATKTLVEYKPILYVENNQDGLQARLLRTLDNFGYVCYWHMPPIFRKGNFYGRLTSPWGGSPITQNVLCLREEADHYLTDDMKKRFELRLAWEKDGKPMVKNDDGSESVMHPTAKIPIGSKLWPSETGV